MAGTTTADPRGGLGDPGRENVFGIDFWAGDTAAAETAVRGWLARGEYFTLAFANPEFLLTAERTPFLPGYLAACHAVFADGVGILWASRLQGGRIRDRITGTDFQWRIFDMATQAGLKVFFYGGHPGVADAAATRVAARFKELPPIGRCDGYQPQHKVLAHIAAFAPDVVMVCTGNPRQEDWIGQHGRATGARLVFGNGGAMDFIAGEVRRAPAWMLCNGLEWLWRLGQDLSWARMRRQARLARYVGKLAMLAVRHR